MKPDLIAITWYDAEEFEAVKALSPDGGGLQDTFEEWLDNARRTAIEFTTQGYRVERVPIKASDLRAWLTANNLKNDEQSRARFGHEIVSAKLSSKH